MLTQTPGFHDGFVSYASIRCQRRWCYTVFGKRLPYILFFILYTTLLRLTYLLPEEDLSRSKRVVTLEYTTHNSCAGRYWNVSFIQPTQRYGKHRICSCLRCCPRNSSSWTPLFYLFVVGTDSFLRWIRGTKKRLKFRKVWQHTGLFIFIYQPHLPKVTSHQCRRRALHVPPMTNARTVLHHPV
jgi:hypothetical protein